MNILITGGNGYVAKSLYNAFKDTYNVFSISRNDFDLTAFQSMNDFFQGKYYDVVIHCAVSGGSRLKQETPADMDINLAMYYNLLQHKPHYGKLIHFGSGAEYYNPESPYGLSKRIISKSIGMYPEFHNIRIYGVFDENELDTRFIKSNILRYINREPMVIHQNKQMDFFYMKDLVMLVDFYIKTDSSLLRDNGLDCTYTYTLDLCTIASIINELDSHRVDINIIEPGNALGYEGGFNDIVLPYYGLKQGIQETYNKLKEKHEII